MTAPITIRLLPHTSAHLRAIIEGGKSYEEKFGIAVAAGMPEFLVRPEVSEAFLTRLREEPAPASASTRILQKCGFKDYSELVDPVDGPIWRWEMARTDFASQG